MVRRARERTLLDAVKRPRFGALSERFFGVILLRHCHVSLSHLLLQRHNKLFGPGSKHVRKFLARGLAVFRAILAVLCTEHNREPVFCLFQKARRIGAGDAADGGKGTAAQGRVR